MQHTLPHDLAECSDASCICHPQLRSCFNHRTARRRDPTLEESQMLFRELCFDCATPESQGDSCLFCRHLRLGHLLRCTATRSNEITYEIEIGMVGALPSRSTGCKFCLFVLRAVELKGVAWHGVWRVEDHANKPMTLGVRKGTKEFTISAGEFTVGVGYTPVVGGEERECKDDDRGRTVPMQLLREWVTRCEELDPQDADQEHATDQPEGMLVIDVERACVVTAPERCRYIALSYVWGPPQEGQAEATKGSIERLQKPGSFLGGDMPATIRDAMLVCRELGERFLWVDRVCIIQDDAKSKAAQINSMGSIYFSAVVTICAAAGSHSGAGLFGTRNTPRILYQEKVDVAGLELTALLPSPRMFRREPWWTRGWTYQEFIFSKRILLFSPWQVVFECKHGAIHECPTSEALPDWNRASKLPALQAYQRTVGEYNDRTLSYASDIYNAFTGVFKSQYGTMDELIYGHPEKDFDASLLWRRGPGERRVVIDGSTGFPSWSWSSATGWVRYHSRFLGALARWEDNGATIIACGSEGANPDWDVVNSQAPQPRIAVAVAWLLGCIESPVPEVITRSRSLAEMQEDLQQEWPTYQAFWESAHGSGTPDISLEADHLMKDRPGRLFFRSTVRTLKIRHISMGLSGTNFDIENDHGRLIGNASTDSFERLEEQSYSFIALSVDGGGSKLASTLFRIDPLLGFAAPTHEEPTTEEPNDKYQLAEVEHHQKTWKNMTTSTLKSSPLLYTPPPEPPPLEEDELQGPWKTRSMSPEVTYHDGQGTALSPPPVINVMMVEYHSGIARRLGIGQVLLVQWAKLENGFQTIVLE